MNLKKKFLLFFVVLCMAIQSTYAIPQPVVQAADITNEAKQDNNVLPSVGTVISGFKVQKITKDADTNSSTIVLTHVKSGAKMVVLKNSDLNRGFAVGFHTKADNNKGINHIIEHSVLGGSQKYPISNMIFNLSNTYASFVNAFTSQNMTIFPVCSQNETQLMKLADVYMDSVYHPLFATNENVFKREAWHYELNKTSDPLSVTGVVYNEMGGYAGDIQTASYDNTQKSLFPDTNQKYESGGIPKDILKLSYKECLKVYKKNYQPSNSIMVLYGDTDYKAFLSMLDKDYLSKYQKKSYTTKRTSQKSFKALKTVNCTFPAGKDAKTKKQSIIDLAFALPDIKKLGMPKFIALSIAANALDDSTSTMKQALIKSGIADSYDIYASNSTYQPVIHFTANNADPSKNKTFYNLVIKQLKETIQKGLDKNLLKSTFAQLKFEKVLGNDQSSAVNQIDMTTSMDDLIQAPEYNLTDAYNAVEKKLNNSYYENLLQKYTLKNKLAVLCTTTPKAGELEKQNTALKKQLKKVKASMTKAQLASIVKQTQNFKEENSKAPSQEDLKKLSGISIKDIPSEIKDYTVKHTTVDGVKFSSAAADIKDAGSTDFNFNLKHLTKEELLYLEFYSDLIYYGMPTKEQSISSVQNSLHSDTYNFNSRVSFTATNSTRTAGYPSFDLSYTGFSKDYPETVKLMSNILLNTDLSTLKTYASTAISNILSNYQAQINDPQIFATYRALSYTNKTYAMLYYLMGPDYYHLVQKIDNELKSNPESVISKLESVREKAFNKNNLTIQHAGNTASIQKISTSIPDFITKLPDKTYETQTYTFERPAKHEAITVNSNVQSVSLNASLSANNLKPCGKLDAISSLLTTNYLIPEIRLKGGAYGAGCYFTDDNYYGNSYSDPNYFNSLNVFNKTDEYLKNTLPTITEDMLESYITTSFAAETMSYGELKNALIALQYDEENYTTADRVQYLNSLKALTVKDLASTPDDLKRLNDSANYVVIASSDAINAHKDLFDSVITLN